MGVEVAENALDLDAHEIDPVLKTMHIHPTLGEVVPSAAKQAAP